jgi:hypothetical protein
MASAHLNTHHINIFWADIMYNTNTEPPRIIYNELKCSVIKESQEELNRKTKVQHNLQTPRLTHHQTNTKAYQA